MQKQVCWGPERGLEERDWRLGNVEKEFVLLQIWWFGRGKEHGMLGNWKNWGERSQQETTEFRLWNWIWECHYGDETTPSVSGRNNNSWSWRWHRTMFLSREKVRAHTCRSGVRSSLFAHDGEGEEVCWGARNQRTKSWLAAESCSEFAPEVPQREILAETPGRREGLDAPHHGPLVSVPFTAVPTNRMTRFDAQPFRGLLCRRIHLPLPLSSRTCRCGRRLGSFGPSSCSVCGGSGFGKERCSSGVQNKHDKMDQWVEEYGRHSRPCLKENDVKKKFHRRCGKENEKNEKRNWESFLWILCCEHNMEMEIFQMCSFERLDKKMGWETRGNEQKKLQFAPWTVVTASLRESPRRRSIWGRIKQC